MRNAEKIEEAQKLREQGLTYKAIAKEIGVAISTASALCNPDRAEEYQRRQTLLNAEPSRRKELNRKGREYGKRAETKERRNQRNKKKRMKELTEQGYNVHPDGYLLDIKCDHCGETFSTKNRGQALRIYSSMYCSDKCYQANGIKTLQARIRASLPQGLRKFNCPYCKAKVETYKKDQVCCGKRSCTLAQQRDAGRKNRGEWTKVELNCLCCGKVMIRKVRKYNRHGELSEEPTARFKYCSAKCTAEYPKKAMTDAWIKQQILNDFKRHEGVSFPRKEISPQMIEDKRLLLKLKRAWKTATGKQLGPVLNPVSIG
tara:strand:+ start:4543 stop:5490 length:948 start_codon:yes stop_codon:yes gene_type:complete